jgi:hypothetical protein
MEANGTLAPAERKSEGASGNLTNANAGLTNANAGLTNARAGLANARASLPGANGRLAGGSRSLLDTIGSLAGASRSLTLARPCLAIASASLTTATHEGPTAGPAPGPRSGKWKGPGIVGHRVNAGTLAAAERFRGVLPAEKVAESMARCVQSRNDDAALPGFTSGLVFHNLGASTLCLWTQECQVYVYDDVGVHFE